MKLIQLPDEPEDEETRAVFAQIAASRGWVSNALRSLSAAPEGLKAFSAVGHYGRYGTQLSEVQRELAILIVARTVPYAWAHHVPLGRQAGIGDAQMDAIAHGRTPDDLPEADRALCDYVFAFLRGEGIPPGVAAALNRHFSPRQVTDISLIAGYYLALGTMLLAFGTEIEPPDILAIELAWQKRQAARP